MSNCVKCLTKIKIYYIIVFICLSPQSQRPPWWFWLQGVSMGKHCSLLPDVSWQESCQQSVNITLLSTTVWQQCSPNSMFTEDLVATTPSPQHCLPCPQVYQGLAEVRSALTLEHRESLVACTVGGYRGCDPWPDQPLSQWRSQQWSVSLEAQMWKVNNQLNSW